MPSLQGRWEHLGATVDALAESHRVITFSLRDETGSMSPLVAQVESALDQSGLKSATILGVSFGGRVALRFAARHPDRTKALVLASVPGPGWHLKASHRWIAQHPLLLSPLFFAGMPARLWTEIARALPDSRERRAFVRRQLGLFVSAPVSPTAMAGRALLIDATDPAADCAAVQAPTLVIAGEAVLDHVVPVDDSKGFAALIAGAHAATLANTGHLGCITHPTQFVALVRQFVSVNCQPDATETAATHPCRQ